MKIFIAGALPVQKLDASVQRFYSNLGYCNVTVFASNGKARNNIGGWNIRNVAVPSYIHGFDFYKQKDIAMTNKADYGFMIWDGESRGTLNNTINLIMQHKSVLMYLTTIDRMVFIKTLDDLNKVIGACAPKTQVTYAKLLRESVSA